MAAVDSSAVIGFASTSRDKIGGASATVIGGVSRVGMLIGAKPGKLISRNAHEKEQQRVVVDGLVNEIK